MTLRILLFICVTALFSSCSSSNKVADDKNSQQLIFGNGGGFTGIYTSYELNEDGRIYKLLPDSSKSKVNRIRKKQTRDMFEQADKLKMALPAFNHPGNMTSFIKYQTGGVFTEYKWGDPAVSVPAEIQDLYNQLNTIVK